MISMKKSIFSVLAVVTILFSSCAGAKKTTENQSPDFAEITGNKWRLIELNGKEVPEKLNGKEPFLVFMAEESRYSASGGCNTMSGEYVFAGTNRISFKPGISTMMACEDMETDKLLAEVFKTTNNYTLADGVLSLNVGRRMPLAKFAKVDAENSLVGTWELDYIANSAKPFNELYPDKKPTLVFDSSSNKVSGNAGCNTFNSSVTINGKNIKFGPMATTRMACPGEGEPLFLQSIEKVNVQSVNGDQLTLIVGDIATMRFKKIK